jgi:hypothetical protein
MPCRLTGWYQHIRTLILTYKWHHCLEDHNGEHISTFTNVVGVRVVFCHRLVSTLFTDTHSVFKICKLLKGNQQLYVLADIPVFFYCFLDKNYRYIGFEVLTVVSTKVAVFWVVVPSWQ